MNGGLHQDHLIKTHQQVLFLASGKFSHITAADYELHWLPVSLHIDYKILLLTFKCIYGLAKTYLSGLISTKSNSSSYSLGSTGERLLDHPGSLLAAVPNFLEWLSCGALSSNVT